MSVPPVPPVPPTPPAPASPAPSGADSPGVFPAPVYLTAGRCRGGGVDFTMQLTDFVVEEIPAYEAEGVGTHCYLRVEKRGIFDDGGGRIF